MVETPEAPRCPYCKEEMTVTIDEFGDTITFCENDCAFWETARELEKLQELKGYEEGPPPPPWAIRDIQTSHCWVVENGRHCPGTVVRVKEKADYPYGHFCPVCGMSLRYHKYWGEGKPGDRANKRL